MPLKWDLFGIVNYKSLFNATLESESNWNAYEIEQSDLRQIIVTVDLSYLCKLMTWDELSCCINQCSARWHFATNHGCLFILIILNLMKMNFSTNEKVWARNLYKELIATTLVNQIVLKSRLFYETLAVFVVPHYSDFWHILI